MRQAGMQNKYIECNGENNNRKKGRIAIDEEEHSTNDFYRLEQRKEIPGGADGAKKGVGFFACRRKINDMRHEMKEIIQPEQKENEAEDEPGN
jgi:hypothetical protein